MQISHLFAVVTLVLTAVSMHGQLISAPEPQSTTITGTVTDANGGVIPGATVTAVGTLADERHEVIADGAGFFSLSGLRPSRSFRLAARADGFTNWSSADMTLSPGQQVDVSEIKRSAEVSVPQ
jgi:carboxypeptidase family protein